MALLPGAAVQAKYDLTRSRFEKRWQYELATGANLVEEGSLMVRAAGAGTTEVVAPSADAASEVPLGVSLQSVINATTFTEVFEGTVPAAVPLELDLGRASIIDVGAGVAEVRARDLTTPQELAVIAPGAPADNQVAIDTATGIATFHAGEAGSDVRLFLRWTLTTTESQQILRESHINRGAEDIFNLVVVGVGMCQVFTTMYDARGIYAVGDVLDCGPGGLFTTAALSANDIPFGRVISIPTTDDPFLGVEYQTPGL